MSSSDSLLLPTITIGLVVITVGLVGLAIYNEGRQWDAWVKEKDCKLVGKIDPSTAVGFDAKGRLITTVIAGKTGWACNDGVTYWR